MSTRFEKLYRLVLPFEHPLHQRVHRMLRSIARKQSATPHLLDVGGRRSNYTIGVPASVAITDIPREKAIQHSLDLGATDQLVKNVMKRRSNIESYVYDDMTQSQLPESSFEIVCAVEVLEHVELDSEFVRNVSRILRPGGLFLMTTPNGDFRPVPYPDHKRHYRRNDLDQLLRRHFADVTVKYCVNSSRLFSFGIHRPSAKAPLRTLLGLFAFALSALHERLGGGGTGPDGKLHLIAVCRKLS